MKILITGGTGLLGQALVATAARDDRLTLLHCREYQVPVEPAEQTTIDVLDHVRLARVFDEHLFDVVVHAAGIASVDYVERHFQEAWQSNVLGTENVLDLVCKKDIRFIYVSSNAVFDGNHAPYREDDATNPTNQYGRIKVECEKLVKRVGALATIVRPILMYGWHFPQGRTNPATWLIDRLTRGERTPMVTDVYENPLLSYHCAEAVWRIIRSGETVIFHIAGKDVVNRYELATMIAREFGLDASLVYPVDSSFFPDIAPRPHNTSFITERMQTDLGMAPLPLAEGLRRMRAQARNVPTTFPGSAL